jgi:hypothetical protein
MDNNTSYSSNLQTDNPIINSTQAITAIIIASISLLSSLIIHYKLKHMKCCCVESDCIQDLGNPVRKIDDNNQNLGNKSLSGILKDFLNNKKQDLENPARKKNKNNKKIWVNNSPNESIKSDDTEIVIDYLQNSHIDETVI